MGDRNEVKMLLGFLEGSKTFNSIVFDGCYNMPPEHFALALNHYINTGETVLDEYSRLIYLGFSSGWAGGGEVYYDKDERIKLARLLRGDGFWNPDVIISPSVKLSSMEAIDRSEAIEKRKEPYGNRRDAASRHIPKKGANIA